MLGNKPSNFYELIGYLTLNPYLKSVGRHGIGNKRSKTYLRFKEAPNPCAIYFKTQHGSQSIMAFKDESDRDKCITYHEDRFTVKHNADDDHTVRPMTFFYENQCPNDVDPARFGD